MNKIRLKSAIDRVQKVNVFPEFVSEKQRVNQLTLLLKEYLRRITHWSKALSYEKKEMISYFFYDVIECVEPNSIADFNEIISNTKFPDGSSELDKKLMTSFMHWEFKKSESHICTIVNRYNLLEPYSPIMIFFELGGGKLSLTNTGGLLIGSCYITFSLHNKGLYDTEIPFINTQNTTKK
ncbi:MAG: hypothetical protein AAF985_07410 [Bacteroidota bacterium]